MILNSEVIITIVFVIAFYKMNVDLDRDIFKQYDYNSNQNREIERDLK